MTILVTEPIPTPMPSKKSKSRNKTSLASADPMNATYVTIRRAIEVFADKAVFHRTISEDHSTQIRNRYAVYALGTCTPVELPQPTKSAEHGAEALYLEGMVQGLTQALDILQRVDRGMPMPFFDELDPKRRGSK